MLVTQLLFKEKVNHKSLRGVLGSGDLYCTSYEELQPTKMTAPGGPVQPEGTGTFCAWQQQRAGPAQPHSFQDPTAPSHGHSWAGQCLLSRQELVAP